MKKILFTILSMLITFSASAEESEMPDFLSQLDYRCGPGKDIKGYEFSYANSKYFLPSQTEIIKDGKTIYKDDTPQDSTPPYNEKWFPPYNGAGIYTSNKYLILQTWKNDCIDIFSTKIFIFSKNGELLLNQDVWTMHSDDGFFEKDGKIAYWSEWFCNERHLEYKSGQSFIYLTDESFTKFERTKVPHKEFCNEDFMWVNLDKIKFKFKDIKPIEK